MRLTVGDLRPGAVLAAPAIGPGGRQLAPVGTTLTAQHLIVLKAWGLTDVEVADDRAIMDQQALIAAQRVAAARFRGQPTNHPAVRVLFTAAVARQLRGGG